MFSHPVPSNDVILLRVDFNEYARRHFLKDFENKYKGKMWRYTEESIVQDLSRIRVSSSDLQKTQQVDELWHKGKIWIFKYDFRVAGTKVSAKASGNRCIVYMDTEVGRAEILMIYNKGNLPKNQQETQYIEGTLKEEFAEYWAEVH